jgi:hypothetical protein
VKSIAQREAARDTGAPFKKHACVGLKMHSRVHKLWMTKEKPHFSFGRTRAKKLNEKRALKKEGNLVVLKCVSNV